MVFAAVVVLIMGLLIALFGWAGYWAGFALVVGFVSGAVYGSLGTLFGLVRAWRKNRGELATTLDRASERMP